MRVVQGMLPVPAAQQLVLQHARRLPVEAMALSPALLGLTLAEDVASDLDSPPFDKSLMDGYAVRSEDGDSQREIVEEIMAGRVPTKPVAANQTSRIMTGAQTPVGADAVVMLERTELLDDGRLRLNETPKPNQNIMPRGREMRRGEVVLQAGKRLRPQELGLLAGVGRTNLSVFRRPVVAILSTGDEIVEPNAVPGPGQIRNSNGSLVAAQVLRAGATPDVLGIARDTLDSLQPLVARGLEADVLLLSGGVSAGKLDLVPGVLEELGVQPVFHKVFMKPGKPLYFGVKDTRLVFGLPGNPVSALVGFELFVRPAVNVLLGRTEPGPRIITARLAVAHRHHSDRPTYHPCKLVETLEGWQATPLPWFGSPDLRAICAADGFCVFEAGVREYSIGESVSVLAME